MDFNLDDPLGDILSDGSNDSFFEIKTKQTSKSASKIQSKSAYKMEDLFGVKDQSKSEMNLSKPTTSDVQLSKKSTATSSPSLLQITKPVPTAPSKPESSNFHDDDLLADLGFDLKKPKSKMNILDDILAPIEPKKQPPTPTITSTGSANKPFSRQSTDTTETSAPGTYAPSLSVRPKTAQRRPSNTSANDPLGLFGSSSTKESHEVIKDVKETPKIKRKGTTADWLGIDIEKKSPKELESSFGMVADATKPPTLSQTLIIQPEPEQLPIPNIQIHQIGTDPFASGSNQRAILMAATNLEAQNALQTLQYQEAQVIKATQMKNQEHILIEMQRKQQDLLLQQESQFNDLLEKQVYRQNQLERSIRSQQDRINAHIQLLMQSPETNLNPGILRPTSSKEKIPNSEFDEERIDPLQLHSDVKRLELEKIRLEDLVSNINANHEKEMDFIENSHKKQIKVLEENLVIVETRLQTEIKSIQEFYNKKLDVSEDEKSNLSQRFDIKTQEIKDDYENRLKALNVQHADHIDCLIKDHKSMIETIRQSKLLEFSVVQENTSYLQTLRQASNNLENVSGGLQSLRDEMFTKIDIENKEKELHLQSREKKLNDSERRLRILEESSEKEKSRLIELVTTLEIQLSKLTSDSADEQWNIRQKLSSLEVERAAFEREKQFTREQFSREDKRIEEMKQFQLDENNRIKQQLQDERQLLSIEKSKLQTAKKLEESSDLNKSKTEVETALKIAQDAVRQADLEREQFFKKHRALECLKRELVNQENEIQSKQDELDSTLMSVKAKEIQMNGALQKHRLAEQNFNAKSQMLHNQMRETSERESYLAEERLILSRERLELQELRKKLELNKCSLCRIGERNVDISNILTRNDIQPNVNLQSFGIRHRPAHIVGDNNVTSIAPNAIDKLFDNDVTESLKRMEFLSRDFKNGYDAETNTINVDLEQLDSNQFEFDLSQN